MNLELTPKEILYTFDAPSLNMKEKVISIPEYDEVYKKIKTSIEIKDSGYNVYLIDNFSKEKINYLKSYIKDILQKKEKPKDICYVIYEDEKSPKTIFLLNGNGIALKKAIEEIQAKYTENTFAFYNSTNNKEKEDILQEIHKKRTELVGNLVESAKVEGFDVRPTSNGFTFTPLKDGDTMTEKEYEEMEVTGKENILNKVSSLKSYAQDILGKLKNM